MTEAALAQRARDAARSPTSCRCCDAAAEAAARAGRRRPATALAARVTSRRPGVGRGGAGRRATRRARPGLGRHLCGGAAPGAALGRAGWTPPAAASAPPNARILALGFAEYGGQIAGGIPMSQVESPAPQTSAPHPRPRRRLRRRDRAAFRRAASLRRSRRPGRGCAGGNDGIFGAIGLDGRSMSLLREQFGRFAAGEVVPLAQGWHLRDALIPLEIVEEMAELGVFGMTIPEAYGGAAWARSRCAWSPKSCRAAISASARSAREPRSRPSSSRRRHA